MTRPQAGLTKRFGPVVGIKVMLTDAAWTTWANTAWHAYANYQVAVRRTRTTCSRCLEPGVRMRRRPAGASTFNLAGENQGANDAIAAASADLANIAASPASSFAWDAEA